MDQPSPLSTSAHNSLSEVCDGLYALAGPHFPSLFPAFSSQLSNAELDGAFLNAIETFPRDDRAQTLLVLLKNVANSREVTVGRFFS